MPTFKVNVTARIIRTPASGLTPVLAALPRAQFDRDRRELAYSDLVHAADDSVARKIVVGRVRNVLEQEGGLSFNDYTLQTWAKRVEP